MRKFKPRPNKLGAVLLIIILIIFAVYTVLYFREGPEYMWIGVAIIAVFALWETGRTLWHYYED